MAEGNKKSMNPALKQSIIAVAVLVVICLVCGLLLALCNDLLYVSDEVKLSRAMQKIYKDYGNGDKEFNEANKNFAAVSNNYGIITDVKKAEDGAYVISAKGGGGYKGTVTLYVVVKQTEDKSDAIIKAWTIKEHDGETFLGNITSKQQSSWYVGKSVKDLEEDSFALSNNKVAGTTLSSTAINNAIKAACQYCKDTGIAQGADDKAKQEIIELLENNGISGYTFAKVTDADGFSEFTIDDGALLALSFYFEGTKADTDSLEAYVYGEGDDIQIVVVKAGLTHAERLAQDIVAKSDNASDNVVNKVKGLSYFEYLVHKSYQGFEYAGMAEIDSSFTATNGTVNKVYTSTDGSVVIEATGTGGFSGGTVSINVVIADGVIKGWWIAYYDASQTYMPTKIVPAWNTVKNWYVGSSINADIVLGDNKITDATMSSTAINNAVNTACKYAREVLSDKEGA